MLIATKGGNVYKVVGDTPQGNYIVEAGKSSDPYEKIIYRDDVILAQPENVATETIESRYTRHWHAVDKNSAPTSDNLRHWASLVKSAREKGSHPKAWDITHKALLALASMMEEDSDEEIVW